MVQNSLTSGGLSHRQPPRLFQPMEEPLSNFLIQSVQMGSCDWQAPSGAGARFGHAGLPVKTRISDSARLGKTPDPTYRLLLDIMWTTGALISKVLALTRSAKQYLPIVDYALVDRIQNFLYAGHVRKSQRIFPIAQQAVSWHIHTLVSRVRGTTFVISAHTFRHASAIYLLPLGRPLKYISQLLGYKFFDRAEGYTHVLSVNKEHFLAG
jgi:integrase